MALETLRRIDSGMWKEAWIEASICNAFALLPIALGTAWYALSQRTPPPLDMLLWLSIQQGELFIMSASGIGATLYLIGKERNFRFPYLLFFVLSLIFLFGVGILFFTLNKASSTPLPTYAIKASFYIYGYTYLISLLAIAIHSSTVDVNGPMRDAENQFEKDFKKRHPKK